ncbi:MAG TPA: DNA polymerase III subunit beta [Planctomycetota bacterium]|nr:DNA polymerase III subunit beta [Planctomycetota bacterium]
MKFTCARAGLVEALQAVSGVVPTRGIKEVFESVKVEASRKDGLTLLGTDLEVSLRYTLPVGDGLEVAEDGVLLAPARRLSAILHELPEGPVSVGWSKGVCSVKASAGSWRVTGGDPADFPAIEIPDASEGIQVERGVLEDLVARTSFAAAKEKMRYALNGILLLVKGDELQGVATDGRRLSLVQAKCRNAGKKTSRAIVPTRALTQLVRVLREEDATVRLAFSESQVAAATGRAVVLARLVEGAFPNFEEVIPVNCERKAVLSRDELTAGLRRAAVLFAAREGPAGSSVRLKFDEGKELVVSATVADVGEAVVSIPCRFEGKGEEVGYNAGFLLEALGVCTEGDVTFEFNSRQSPGRLSDGDRFTHVVMPVTLE